MLTGLLAAMVVLTGCTRQIDGAAAVGPREVDPAYFFAGEIPVYGQSVSPSDVTALAYLRAMRRIDPCGLLNRDALSKIGEIGSVGTLFALDECDMDIKMPGQSNRRFASIELTWTRVTGTPVAFRAGQAPVYAAFPGSCEYLLPLELSRLPGAQPLHKPDQPFLRIGLIAEENCDIAQRLVRAVAPRIESSQLPVRDAVATYPAALAERDPCQVLSVVGGEVDHWDINRTRPYECDFGIWRNGFPEVVPMQVTLEPQIVDIATDGRERRDRNGVEIYIDTAYCSAIAFVGAPMQRKLVGGDFVDTGAMVIRPAVVVDSGGQNCDAVADVAVAAAKLYS
jgi:hypothetical protein